MAQIARTPTSRRPARRTEKVDLRNFPKARDLANAVETKLKEYVNTQSMEDPFEGIYFGTGGALSPITPPYNWYALGRLPFENSMLLQCIEAMVRNCDGHGHQLEYVGPEGQREGTAAQAEKKTIENLLRFPNPDYSFQELRERLRYDYENVGNCFMEAPRDRLGRVASLHHIPAQTIRRTMRDWGTTNVELKLPRDGQDTALVTKRFCRFVQLIGDRKVYFKEWGDPRKIDPATGEENNDLLPNQQATEIIHRAIYYPLSPYGVPRWINQLPSIMGSRQAELTNYDFFKENAIPAMAVMVAGGQLTAKSLENIEDMLTAVRGRAATHRMVIMEAKADEDMASDTGQVAAPKIEMKSLRDAQQGDALFQEYEADCADKTRSSFRLPPLFVGLSEDMTYATAQTSYDVAEGQVFGPERRGFDEMMDHKVLASYDAKFWAFRSNPAKITDHAAVTAALTAFNTMGALTPNTAIKMANEYFDLEIDSIAEEWGNWPFDIVKLIAQSGSLKGTDEIKDQVDTGLQGAGIATHDIFGKPVGQDQPGAANQNKPGSTGSGKAPTSAASGGKGKPVQAAGQPKKPQVAGKADDVDPRLFVAAALVQLREILKGNADDATAAA